MPHAPPATFLCYHLYLGWPPHPALPFYNKGYFHLLLALVSLTPPAIVFFPLYKIQPCDLHMFLYSLLPRPHCCLHSHEDAYHQQASAVRLQACP
jgi:hypothetical protein